MKLSRTILVADDSENDLLLMRRAFEKADFQIRLQEARSGEEAIAYLAGEGIYADRHKYPLPSVVLLDINMPMKNGFDVLRSVRSQPALQHVSIMILTSSARPEDVDQALLLGADSYLVKPSNLESLASMMRCLKEWMRINHFIR